MRTVVTVQVPLESNRRHEFWLRRTDHMKAAFLLGRLMFGGLFLYNGINHLKQRQALSQYAGSKQVPNPDLAV